VRIEIVFNHYQWGLLLKLEGFMERLLRRYPRTTLPATLLQELHIPHHHATVYCFAHIVDCESRATWTAVSEAYFIPLLAPISKGGICPSTFA
jgi:hypothetical protein